MGRHRRLGRRHDCGAGWAAMVARQPREARPARSRPAAHGFPFHRPVADRIRAAHRRADDCFAAAFVFQVERHDLNGRRRIGWHRELSTAHHARPDVLAVAEGDRLFHASGGADLATGGPGGGAADEHEAARHHGFPYDLLRAQRGGFGGDVDAGAAGFQQRLRYSQQDARPHHGFVRREPAGLVRQRRAGLGHTGFCYHRPVGRRRRDDHISRRAQRYSRITLRSRHH